jgi:hypothetical protein
MKQRRQRAIVDAANMKQTNLIINLPIAKGRI